jgi:hypothetical protein
MEPSAVQRKLEGCLTVGGQPPDARQAILEFAADLESLDGESLAEAVNSMSRMKTTDGLENQWISH